MLGDEQWSDLEPLTEACRPHAKVLSPHLRRNFEAILWRHQNGAKWRVLPAEFGPWWMAAQTLIHRARLGVWERPLALVQEHGVRLGMVFLDGTNIRAHQRAAGASPKWHLQRSGIALEALGRSRGGYGTRACVMADVAGRAIAFRLAPAQAHELPHAVPLLDRLPGVPKWVVAERGDTSHAFRQHIWDLGARPESGPFTMKRRLPARTRSTTTAIGSNADGRG